MKTAHAAIASAKTRLKSAVSALDGKFAAIPLPATAGKNATPGQILALIAAAPAVDFVSTIKAASAVKNELYAQRAKAFAELDAARREGDALLSCAEHISSGTPLNIDNPVLEAAARTVRKGVLAGVVPVTISDELKRLATQGLMTLAAGTNELERIASAGRVAHAKNMTRLYGKCAAHQGYDVMHRKLFADLKHRAATAADERHRQHRVKFMGV